MKLHGCKRENVMNISKAMLVNLTEGDHTAGFRVKASCDPSGKKPARVPSA